MESILTEYQRTYFMKADFFMPERRIYGIMVPQSYGVAVLPQACLARQNGQRSELCERRNIAKQYVAEP